MAPALTYKWVVLSNTTIGTADRWQKRTGNEIENRCRDALAPGAAQLSETRGVC